MPTLQEVAYSSPNLRLLVNGNWIDSKSTEYLPVMNPAKGVQISKVPLTMKGEVDAAVSSSQDAFEKWKEVPVSERTQLLFRMKYVMEEHFEELARINTQNHGKTIVESRGDIRRAIENIEAAIAAGYTLSKGEQMDSVSEGVDEGTVKEPLGVFAIICPFNFPIMVPFWFIPYAIVLGCTVVVKPSEVTPVPMAFLAELLQKEAKIPPGVLNIVHGSKETVEAMISHPNVKGVTFVGSTSVGRYVYKLAGEHGKRAIVQAGAKNSILVMADANLPETVESCSSSFFGNAGQRCLAGANLIVAADVHGDLVQKFTRRAEAIKLGYGLDESVEMGPLVSGKAKERTIRYMEEGESEGAKIVLDGRRSRVPEYENGYFLGPTIFDQVSPDMVIAKDEIFGPVANVIEVPSLEEAIELINRSTNYGNAASISHVAARLQDSSEGGFKLAISVSMSEWLRPLRTSRSVE